MRPGPGPDCQGAARVACSLWDGESAWAEGPQRAGPVPQGGEQGRPGMAARARVESQSSELPGSLSPLSPVGRGSLSCTGSRLALRLASCLQGWGVLLDL